MSWSLGEAVLEIVGDSSKLLAEFNRDEAAGKNFVARMSIGLKGIMGVVIPGGIALGIAKIGLAAIESGDQLLHLKDQPGISVETLTGMQYVGKMVDVSMETRPGSMARLSRQMAKGEDEMGK